MQKSVIFVLNVLRGIRDASKIHGLQQGNKIACPNYSTDMCFCVRSLVVPALNASMHGSLYRVSYLRQQSAHLRQHDHSSSRPDRKCRDEMDEQARVPPKTLLSCHLIQVDKYPCPGDTSAHSGLDTTVTCQSVHYSTSHAQHVTSRPSDNQVSNRAGISIVHTTRALKRPHRAMI